MNRVAPSTLVSALALTLLPSCATPQAEAPKPASSAPATPKVEQQQLANNGWLDVALFSTDAPSLPSVVSNEVLLGVELLARPHVLECLVAPAHRGADKRTRVLIAAKLTDTGVSHKVSGDNLPPAGASCIEAALSKWTAALPGLNAKAAAGATVSAELEIVHTMGVLPAVVMGLNEASDANGTVRLALPAMGECFAEWKSTPPSLLKGSLALRKPSAGAALAPEVKLAPESASDAAGAKVATCLQGKLAALPFKAPAGEALTVPLTLRFVHSAAGESLPGAPADLQFTQLDLARGRRAADSLIAIGGRNAATSAYDDAVKRYKAGAKDVSVKELKDKCAALLAADDKLIDAAQKALTVEDVTHRFAEEQKAKDPSWAEAEAASAKKQGEARKDLETFKAAKVADEAACPKTKG
jgi:hypothetical protein